jgi:hypothetical protein
MVRRSLLFSSIFIFLLFVVSSCVQDIRAERELRNQRISELRIQVVEYEKQILDCVDGWNLFNSPYDSNPRSRERFDQVAAKFYKLSDAPCVMRNGKIWTNPYKKVDLSQVKAGANGRLQQEMYRGLLYEFDRGVPFLRSGGTLCEDGWISSSRGRGTCSWHGGYAQQRGDLFTFDSSKLKRDPREKLEQLLER